MNIYRKTISKLKKIMKSVQDEYDALLENDGEKLIHVRNLGRKSFKEVMDKVGNAK